MQSRTILISLLALAVCASAEQKANPLVFKADGTFKILHVSDAHYQTDEGCCCRNVDHTYPCSGKNTTDLIEKIIELEKPDFMVFMGDITDWCTHPATAGMDAIYGLASKHGIPWAATLGNHDH